MNNYEEKKEARIERLKHRAINAAAESKQYSDSPHIKAVIDMGGEPIKIGHHSERRHRNLIKKADNAMRKSFEMEKYAEDLQARAIAAEENTAIATEDPAAILKLKEKLSKLEEKRDRIKVENKKLKKENKAIIEAFYLQNLGANIRSVKQRIEHLKKRENLCSKTYKIGDIEINENVEENRVKIFFPSKPNENVRANLKKNGFRWSSFNGCWQRHYSYCAIYLAKEIIGEVK